jgi:hypothetical protein
MNANRSPDEALCSLIEAGFVAAIELAYDVLGEKAFKPAKAFNAAVFDAVLTGIAKRQALGEISDRAGFHAAYLTLMSDAEFIAETSRSTANDESVKKRLQKATAAFAAVR